VSKQPTPKQKRTLNWILTQAGFDPNSETARDVLEAVCGKRRRRDMDFGDYKRAIGELLDRTGIELDKGKSKKWVSSSAPGESHPRRKATPGDPNAPVTRQQMDYIYGLFDVVGAESAYLRAGICRKAIGYPWPRTVGEGQAVLEALKSIEQRGGLDKNEKNGE